MNLIVRGRRLTMSVCDRLTLAFSEFVLLLSR